MSHVFTCYSLRCLFCPVVCTGLPKLVLNSKIRATSENRFPRFYLAEEGQRGVRQNYILSLCYENVETSDDIDPSLFGRNPIPELMFMIHFSSGSVSGIKQLIVSV